MCGEFLSAIARLPLRAKLLPLLRRAR